MGVMKLKFLPICTQQPKTTSFREEIFKTVNSAYIDREGDAAETPESCFTRSSESTSSPSTEHDHASVSEECHVEAIVRGAQQSSSADQRLFFEPGGDTSSILSDTDPPGPTKNEDNNVSDVRSLTPTTTASSHGAEGVMLTVESENPYEDFKESMREMVESLGVRDDWEGLEELLGWYLKVNGKSNHGYIVCAFVDLLASNAVDDNDESSVKSSTSFSSAASSLSSSSLTPMQLLEEASSVDHLVC